MHTVVQAFPPPAAQRSLVPTYSQSSFPGEHKSVSYGALCVRREQIHYLAVACGLLVFITECLSVAWVPPLFLHPKLVDVQGVLCLGYHRGSHYEHACQVLR